MSYKTVRTSKRLAKASKRKFITTLLVVAFLAYAAITWVLPGFIGALRFVNSFLNPPSGTGQKSEDNPALAPPVINIPFEATNTATIDILGYATPNVEVKIYVDDKLQNIVKADTDGNFKFIGVKLNLGTNNIYGKTQDESTESLPSKAIKLVYDNVKPKLEVLEPQDGSSTESEKLGVTGKTDPDAYIFINDTRIIVNSDGSFSYNLSLNEGENIIRIKATDKASNSTEIEKRVTYKRTEDQPTQ